MFWMDIECYFMFSVVLVFMICWQLYVVCQFKVIVVIVDVFFQQVYGWVVDKVCYKVVGWFFIYFYWGVDLFGNVFVYYYYLLGEGYCFYLVMGDVQ